MRLSSRRRSASLFYLDLAAIVFSLGVVLAFAIPTYQVARGREAQRVTMKNIRAIATILEARAAETKSFAFGAAGGELRRVPWSAVERALVPRYARELPRHDGWDRSIGLFVNDRHYVLRSAGSDGRFEGSHYSYGVSPEFEMDLVFADGNFLRYPEGI